jgi:hypothetical protein
MSTYSIENIIDFVKEASCEKSITEESEICDGIGLYGDDFHEFIDKFASNFQVNMSEYLWYFHTEEESSWNSIGGLFFDPPYKRVKRIPVTVSMLFDFANKGKWDIVYPEHKLPKRRYDLIINSILVFGFFAWLIIWGIIKLIKK